MDYDLTEMPDEFCENCQENSMVKTSKDNEWACRICGKVEGKNSHECEEEYANE